jgi:hypothetical protein
MHFIQIHTPHSGQIRLHKIPQIVFDQTFDRCRQEVIPIEMDPTTRRGRFTATPSRFAGHLYAFFERSGDCRAKKTNRLWEAAADREKRTRKSERSDNRVTLELSQGSG